MENRNRFLVQRWIEEDTHYLDYIFEIVGRGDVNGDGLDDIILRMTTIYYPTSGMGSELYLLSLGSVDDILRVVEVLSPLASDRNNCVPGTLQLWKPR